MRFLMKILSPILIVILALFLVACNGNNNYLGQSKYDKRFVEELDMILDNFDDVSNMYGVTVSYNGTRLSEKYFNHSETDFDHNIFSVTKSVMSILVGIAIDEGYITGVDGYISDYIDLTSYDNKEELEDIQIKHLLTMTAGLNWNSNDLASEMISLRSSSDPLSYVLEREMDSAPGTTFNYSDGAAHLMSIVLESATGLSALDFAAEYLFTPLDIVEPYWNEDKAAHNIGGCDLYLSLESMEKIGYLVLNDGAYNERQIVPSSWLEEAVSSENSVVDFYGYYWWLSSYMDYEIISAKGWGGQLIYIVPELDIVITTGANGIVSNTTAGNQFNQIEHIIKNDILHHFISFEE